MASNDGISRRKRAGPGRQNESPRNVRPNRGENSLTGGLTQEALDVARYVADMTAQLEAMAIAARLDLLAYFLGMAKAESELFVRTNPAVEVDTVDDQSFEVGGPEQIYKPNTFD
jgi:hypothetical protein